jgi:hypothetical protein
MCRSRSQQRFPRNYEDAVGPAAGIRPHERQPWKGFFHALAIMSHLDDEHAACIQMRRRTRDNTAYQIEPITSAGQRHRRLASILGR